MTVDYSVLLDKLQRSLETAINNQEYHRLVDLDVAVRECVEGAIKECERNSSLKEKLARQIKEILAIYKIITQTCSDKSQDLKKELHRLKHSQKGATQYLQVAGKMGR